MKRRILLASALGLALQVGVVGHAAAVEPVKGKEQMEGRRHLGMGERPEAISGRLKLNADQKKVFDAAFKERRDKMVTLQDEFMVKKKAIMDASDSKIIAILNADQKAEFAKIKEESENRRDEFKTHKGNRNNDRSEPSGQK